MKIQAKMIFCELLERMPELKHCEDSILTAYGLLVRTFVSGGKLLTCGNGGSASDAEHIVGELMKGFRLKRSVPEEVIRKIFTLFSDDGLRFAASLQQALPALCLSSHTAFTSAFVNDVNPSMVYAQQVYGIGKPDDTLLGISTSGNSENVVNAVKMARALGIKAIGLTGGNGGELAAVCDVAIVAPAVETYRVQEYHLPIYHTLCAMLEDEFFRD